MFKSKFLSMLMALTLICSTMCVSSCSDDEDSPSNSGTASLTIDGKTIKYKYVGYVRGYDEDDDSYFFGIMFTDYKLDSKVPPKKANALIIDIDGNGKDLPTGTFQPGDYDLTVMVDWDMYNENSGMYLEEHRRKCGPLTIAKNGSNYTISLPQMGLEGWKDGDDINGEEVSFETSFEYTGSIKYYSKLEYN